MNEWTVNPRPISLCFLSAFYFLLISSSLLTTISLTVKVQVIFLSLSFFPFVSSLQSYCVSFFPFVFLSFSPLFFFSAKFNYFSRFFEFWGLSLAWIGFDIDGSHLLSSNLLWDKSSQSWRNGCYLQLVHCIVSLSFDIHIV